MPSSRISVIADGVRAFSSGAEGAGEAAIAGPEPPPPPPQADKTTHTNIALETRVIALPTDRSAVIKAWLADNECDQRGTLNKTRDNPQTKGLICDTQHIDSLRQLYRCRLPLQNRFENQLDPPLQLTAPHRCVIRYDKARAPPNVSLRVYSTPEPRKQFATLCAGRFESFRFSAIEPVMSL